MQHPIYPPSSLPRLSSSASWTWLEGERLGFVRGDEFEVSAACCVAMPTMMGMIEMNARSVADTVCWYVKDAKGVIM